MRACCDLLRVIREFTTGCAKNGTDSLQIEARLDTIESVIIGVRLEMLNLLDAYCRGQCLAWSSPHL